jgi:hypothetical protein
MIWGCGFLLAVFAAIGLAAFFKYTLGLPGEWWWVLGFLGWFAGIWLVPHRPWSFPAYLSIPLVVLAWAVSRLLA